MYPAAMAETVNLFESSPPGHQEREPDDVPTEYNNVFEGLRHAVQVSEVVFARAVKADLRDRLSNRHIPIRLVLPEEAEVLPVWSAQSSVALLIPVPPERAGDWDKAKENLRPLLESLVSSLAHQIIDSWQPGLQVDLVGPVETRIHAVRSDVYNFVIKQKWSVSLDGRR